MHPFTLLKSTNLVEHPSLPTKMFLKSSASLLIFTYAATLRAASVTPMIPEAITTIPQQDSFFNNSSSCGGSLTATSGIISYKTSEPVQPNERCVWIVRAANATAYNVSISNLGIPSSVIISGFPRFGIVNHTMPISNGSIGTDTATSGLLVITFYTGPSNNTRNKFGFSLTYSAFTNAAHWFSSTSEDVTFAAGSGHIKYPSRRNLYDNNELSTFVTTPVIGVDGQFKNSTLIYLRVGLEKSSCADILRVYVFDIKISGAYKWKLVDIVCAGVDSLTYAIQDMTLITFQSDGSRRFEGFHLYSLLDS